MRTYYTTRNPEVLFDPQAGCGLTPGSALRKQADAEIAAGTAQLLPWPKPTRSDRRRAEYDRAGLSFPAWQESIIEFLGTLPNPPAKFAALWAKREDVRSQIQ